MPVSLPPEKFVKYPRDLKQGQVAVIVDTDNPNYLGQIVQRHGEDLIRIGGRRNEWWASVCRCTSNCDLELRVLKDGTQITITNNE